MDFIKKGAPQFKANLHSHSTLSDGDLTPEEMIAAYKERGYSILSITDHEAPYDHTDKSTEDFMLLTGWEAYIRPSAECKLDAFGPEIHINLLAKDPHNTTFVAYDPNFCRYMPHEAAEKLPHAGDELGPRRYNVDYINRFIQCAREAGYLVTYNHPAWSMEEPETVLAYEGYFSLEVLNAGSSTINGMENNLALYARMMRHGKFPFVHGSDDNHNKHPFHDLLNDSFGAWTMILADKLEYASVIEALEKGNFYASNGPTIHALSFEGNKVHLEFTEAQHVMLLMSGKRCLHAYNSDGSPITSADFVIPDYAPYFFLVIRDEYGHEAITHAFTRADLGLE